MNTDEIIEMAKQAGFISHGDSFYTHHRYGDCKLELEAFAKLVAAKATDESNARSNTSWTLMCKKMVEDERDACLQIQEDWQYVYASDLVQKIRARGEA